MGKTTLTEWLGLRSFGGYPNGWSPVGGRAAGIFHDLQDPGGSSTGSALAAALGLAAVVLGTEVRQRTAVDQPPHPLADAR